MSPDEGVGVVTNRAVSLYALGHHECPPTVNVTPSILTPEYHGYLRHGVLTDPV